MSHTVLIVDDSAPNRLLPALILKPLGWHVVEAADGASALRAAEATALDCVLLDLLLPDFSGESICAALRQRYGSALRIVAYTAEELPDGGAALLTHGFDAVVKKPLSRNTLLAALGDPA